MLTDTTLRNLKPRPTRYKVSDRDGMYALVSPTGVISFRYDYRLNGRRETLVIGRYGPRGLTLALARARCLEARRAVERGESPVQVRRREKDRAKEAKTFCAYAEDWFRESDLADSTKAMRRGVYNRDIYPRVKKRVMTEITEDDVRGLCEKIKARNAPATALHVRDVIKSVFDYAALKGLKIANPAASVAPKAITTIKPRDRALSPLEVRLMLQTLEHIQATADHRLAIRLILLTLVRKGELIGATWDEVNFEAGIWTIPKERMKGRRPHNVYLSRQVIEILTALKSCAGRSRYVLPSRHDPAAHISPGSLNRLTQSAVVMAKGRNLPLEDFTLHDLRRTGSTILNEVGFNGDWIEKCLAHEQGHSSRGVYNKAQYAEQRRHMLQEWANMIDAESMSRGAYSLPLARWGARVGDATMIDWVTGTLNDPFHAFHMGMTAENVAERHGITRQMQDELALESQKRAARAIADGRCKSQIVGVELATRKGPVIFDTDEHVRPNSDLEALARLKPVFKEQGTVTAGNASGMNDGAAAVMLASEEAVKNLELKPLARLVGYAHAGVEPAYMGMGPVPATRKLLQKYSMSVQQLDVIEANEAFAAQACAVMRELELDPAKVNPNGSGISLGHPIGATGAIIATKAIHEQQRIGGRFALVTMCIGGGQGIAALFERT